MLSLHRHQQICRQFAALLRYPGSEVAALATECALSVAPVSRSAAESVGRFAAFAGRVRPAEVEEAYSATFELQALCHPYVGYLLCGENQQRTVFMLKLRELYNRHGFRGGNDLPDHFGEVLDFVAATDSGADCRDLLADGLLPALEKILAERCEADRPYLDLLRALRSFLAATLVAAQERAATDRIKELSA